MIVAAKAGENPPGIGAGDCRDEEYSGFGPDSADHVTNARFHMGAVDEGPWAQPKAAVMPSPWASLPAVAGDNGQ